MKSNLQKVLENIGYNPRSYSGRGMYNETCLAIATDNDINGVFADILSYVIEHNCKDDDLSEDVRKMKSDSFGKIGIVVYFPGIKYCENEDNEEDNEEDN